MALSKLDIELITDMFQRHIDATEEMFNKVNLRIDTVVATAKKDTAHIVNRLKNMEDELHNTNAHLRLQQKSLNNHEHRIDKLETDV